MIKSNMKAGNVKTCKEDGCSNPKAEGRSRCYSCYGKARRGSPKPNHIKPSPMRVLFLDIETSPDVVYTWSHWNTNIGNNQVIKTGEIMCFSAKWFGDDNNLFFHGRTNHLDMLDHIWNLMTEADVIIHYYGSEFDVKWLNREFIENGYWPPSPFKQIDLKKAVCKSFKFPSNKLQFITTQLDLEGKVDHEGFPLWSKCLNGDDDAWARMEEYNRQDVTLLEELYEIMLPWIPNHPHRYLYDNSEKGCPTCGYETLTDAGFAYTKVSKFPQYRCLSCGSFFRESKRVSGVKIQESVL